MKKSNSEIVHGFGTVVAAVGSFGVGICTVGLIVALVRSGNISAALGVGIAVSAVLVYVGDWCRKLAALNEILSFKRGMEGSDGNE